MWPVEPTTDDILLKYDQVVSTPHLGASTKEAQLRAGTQVAEQVALALKGQFAPNAVNVPLVLGEEADELMPYLHVCELLGKLTVQIADGPVDTLEITYEGVISRYDTRILTLSVLSGLLSNVVEGGVNFVNVTSIAEERGIVVKENKKPAAVDFLNLITVTARDDNGELSVSGTTLGPKHKPRLVKLYRQDIDIEPAEHMAFLRYDDVPGMIGKIGTKMGALGINIAQMSVGRTLADHKAVMGLTLDSPIAEDDLQSLIKRRGPARRQAGEAVARTTGGGAAQPPRRPFASACAGRPRSAVRPQGAECTQRMLPSLSLNQAASSPPRSATPSWVTGPGPLYSSKVTPRERSSVTVARTSSTSKVAVVWSALVAPRS